MWNNQLNINQLVWKFYIQWKINIFQPLIMCVAQSCLTLYNLMDCSLQPSLSVEFSRQEYWSGLPFPSPRDLPDPGPNWSPLYLPHWQVCSLQLAPPEKPSHLLFNIIIATVILLFSPLFSSSCLLVWLHCSSVWSGKVIHWASQKIFLH